MRLKRFLLSTACFLSLTMPATAHTPYLAPTSFEPVFGNMVTLDASFAEHFFVPEIALNDSAFGVVGPDGKLTTPDTLTLLKTRVVVEHTLTEKGTYKFTTGPRLGRVFRIYTLNGKRHSLEKPEDTLPKGAIMQEHFQSVSLAETYVSKGAPDRSAIKASNEGLEVLPKSHPNELYNGEDFVFSVQFEGQPLPDSKLDIFEASGAFGPKDPIATVTTNKEGAGTFLPEKPGVYLMRARHRTPAPKGAAAPVLSHTYTLVFEVAR